MGKLSDCVDVEDVEVRKSFRALAQDLKPRMVDNGVFAVVQGHFPRVVWNVTVLNESFDGSRQLVAAKLSIGTRAIGA